MRTGKIGLVHLLNKARVPGYNTSICRCGQAKETPSHILLYCPEERDRRVELGPNRSFVKLVDTPEGTLVASKWAIRSG
jgi:hypothetical protein